MTINQALICGFLGQDPELKNNSATGNDLCFFTVATRRSSKNEAGEWETSTDWHNIVTFGRLATQASQLKKGARVTIIGNLRTRKWTGKDGIDRYKTEIIAEKLEFLSSASDDVAPQRSAPVAQQAMPTPTDEDSIPF